MGKELLREYLQENAVWSYFKNPDYYDQDDVDYMTDEIYEDIFIEKNTNYTGTMKDYIKELEEENPDGYDLGGSV